MSKQKGKKVDTQTPNDLDTSQPDQSSAEAVENQVNQSEETTEAPPSLEAIQASLEATIMDLQDRLLRNQAELQNFKRRMTEERIKDRIHANLELIQTLLTPLDDFERGLRGEAHNEHVIPHLKGFEMIRNSFMERLESQGLQEVEAVDRPFDPKLHQAVATEKNPDFEPGHVIEVYQKGYLYKDRLVRPAMVKVSE